MESDKRRFPRLFKILINISLAILSTTIFFGSLEIYSRYRYYGGNLRPIGLLGRGKSYTYKKQTPLRIICIGESTTHGMLVGDTETYPSYLEKIINERFDKPFVEVINSGFPAKSTEYLKDIVKERLGDQELDTILLHSLYNHFVQFQPCKYNPMISKFIVDVHHAYRVKTIYHWNKMSLAEIINVFLLEHTYFYLRLREKILRIKNIDLNKYYATKKEYKPEAVEIKTEVYEVNSEEDRKKIETFFITRYYNAVENIILTAKSHNVDVILIIPPYPFYGEDSDKNRQEQYFNNVFEKAKLCLITLGHKHNLLVIDTDIEFLKRGRNADWFSADGVHLTTKGNYILADIIASKMIPYLKRFSLASGPSIR